MTARIRLHKERERCRRCVRQMPHRRTMRARRPSVHHVRRFMRLTTPLCMCPGSGALQAAPACARDCLHIACSAAQPCITAGHFQTSAALWRHEPPARRPLRLRRPRGRAGIGQRLGLVASLDDRPVLVVVVAVVRRVALLGLCAHHALAPLAREQRHGRRERLLDARVQVLRADPVAAPLQQVDAPARGAPRLAPQPPVRRLAQGLAPPCRPTAGRSLFAVSGRARDAAACLPPRRCPARAPLQPRPTPGLTGRPARPHRCSWTCASRQLVA